ncbi:MAG: DUF547 domain-containing protein [Candidatus Heimdallarchaeota archaeon]|nr:MAG: DUF547 domain-containing protein [Candidatus Heimdallarchaeota archaeon]
MLSSTPSLTNLNVLKPFIDANGLVDYNGLKEDKWLHEQVLKLKTADLHGMSYSEEYAFWLNAYNILTLKGVFMELERNPNWSGNISFLQRVKFFYLRRFSIAGKKINLYNLENKILRKRFKDPRIHFAINCGSKSCPNLPDNLFTPETLVDYLTTLTSSFINDKDHVFLDVKSKTLFLNPIFKWYKKDFQIKGGVKEFILNYLENPEKSFIQIFKSAKIEYTKYDWELNSQDTGSLLKIDVIK